MQTRLQHSFKMDSKPFTPTPKKGSSNQNLSTERKELAAIKLIYSKNYLMLLKEANKDFPDNYDKVKVNNLFSAQLQIQQQPVPTVDSAEESVISSDEVKRKQAREKQILFGKGTTEYQNYSTIIPKEKRRTTDPKTPDIECSVSKRRWDQIVRRWRRALHAFDDVHAENQIELARALAMRLENEHDPKRKAFSHQFSCYSPALLRDE